MGHKEDGGAREATSAEGIVEKRREERYGVPDRFKRYMKLDVRAEGRQVPAVLANFSRSGILFESEVPLDAGSRAECILSLSLLVVRDIAFSIQVKYCLRNDRSYVIGAAIDAIADDSWFSVFEEIHDFIVLRKNAV